MVNFILMIYNLSKLIQKQQISYRHIEVKETPVPMKKVTWAIGDLLKML